LLADEDFSLFFSDEPWLDVLTKYRVETDNFRAVFGTRKIVTG